MNMANLIPLKEAAAMWKIYFVCLILIWSGCEPVPAPEKAVYRADGDMDLSIYTHYAPVKLNIMPLSEIICPSETEERSKIRIYVSLLDSFGWQKRAPGIFRFEFYERVERSADHKGKRIVIWPDIDLTDSADNNIFWLDFLRVYRFDLDFGLPCNRSYVMQVTCMCPDGKRLSAEFIFIQSLRDGM